MFVFDPIRGQFIKNKFRYSKDYNKFESKVLKEIPLMADKWFGPQSDQVAGSKNMERLNIINFTLQTSAMGMFRQASVIEYP